MSARDIVRSWLPTFLTTWGTVAAAIVVASILW